MEDILDKLLRIEKENNKMLKYIIKYINHNLYREHNEELEDFGRNVLANVISNKFHKQLWENILL